MQMCACYKEQMREIVDDVFCALCTVCPGAALLVGIAKTATSKTSNECETFGQLGLVWV